MALNYHHTAVHTINIAESVAWYVENLNAEILSQDKDWAMLQIGDMKLALTLPEKHPPHIAFEVDSLEKFPCCSNEVKLHRDGSYYYYQEAPDGTVIEWLYWELASKK